MMSDCLVDHFRVVETLNRFSHQIVHSVPFSAVNDLFVHILPIYSYQRFVHNCVDIQKFYNCINGLKTCSFESFVGFVQFLVANYPEVGKLVFDFYFVQFGVKLF
jgi:hypothetical protein